MDEFSLIREFFLDATPAGDDVVLGIGDDAAVLEIPAPWQLVLCVDTLVAGRHFPSSTAAADIGWKALAVNLSDLAAMGAMPRWFTLALTLPEADTDWVSAFSAGLAELARSVPVSLVGGDTTRGPLSMTVTAGGWIEAGKALCRDGAQPGDAVCVTGTLGDAALALRRLPVDACAVGDAALRQRLDRPTPRIAAGRALRRLAHAAIDVSDGLAADLGHMLQGRRSVKGAEALTSSRGAVIDLQRLPRSPEFAALAPTGDAAVDLQLAGGDDYELCFCLDPADVAAARERLLMVGVPLTVVGRVITEPGVWLDDGASRKLCTVGGFNHFGVAST